MGEPVPTYDGELATVAVCHNCGWGVYAHECPAARPSDEVTGWVQQIDEMAGRVVHPSDEVTGLLDEWRMGELTRCRGITKRGQQCSRYTRRNPSYCWEHC